MKRLLEQIIKFGGVGLVCTAVEYGLLFLMEEAFSLNLLLATPLSFLASTILNYILSVKFVFKVDNGRGKATNAGVFVIMSAIGLAINQAIMTLGVYLLGALMDKLYMLVKVVATVIVMVYNFITRKLFLEKTRPSAEGDKSASGSRKNTGRIWILVSIVAALLVVIGVIVALALREPPPEPTVDIFTNENSVYSAKVIDNALKHTEGTPFQASTPEGECVFEGAVDKDAADSYSMLIFKDGDTHDLYLKDPVDQSLYLVSSGFDAEGDPMVYRHLLDGQAVYLAHVPETDVTNIYVICQGRLILECLDYDMHDVDLDGVLEIVTYGGEQGEQLVLLDFTSEGAFTCNVAQATGVQSASFYYRARISFFECRDPGQYPAFYSLRDGKLVERARQLAVYEDYLYPNSSAEKLSYSDLYNMYSTTVAYAYNEIAARHGCIFEDSEFSNYFRTTRWYRPQEGFSEADLSPIELYNSITIRSYMNNVNANAYNNMADYSKADLDGDGTQESISVANGQLYINQQAVAIYGDMNYMYFHVVDVNIEIPGFQVAVVGYNSDARFVVEIFEYNQGAPVSAGVIAGYTDISYPGNGHISVKLPCGLLYENIMQEITETYSLRDGQLMPDAVDVYSLVQLLETSRPLTLYSAMSTETKAVEVKADTEVAILATDRVNWLFIQAETGETGWLYCQDGQVDGVDIDQYFYDLIGGY